MTETNLGRIIGPEGPAGKSAYQYAQEGGFEGSEQEFAEKLATEYLKVSGGEMTGPLHMNGQVLDGLNDPKQDDEAARKAYVDKSVRESAPVNLLDNSDFRYPVAQAGVGGFHGNQAYALDRWILTNGTVSHQEGIGLTLNGIIKQKLEHPPTEAVSAFVGMASGQANISYDAQWITITSAGGVIAWVALYEGSYSADAMPDYHSKGYTAELSACKWYYRRNTGNYIPFQSYSQSGAVLSIQEGPMRIPPTVSILPTVIVANGGGQIGTNDLQFQSIACTGDMIKIGITDPGSRMIPDTTYFMRDADISLIADPA